MADIVRVTQVGVEVITEPGAQDLRVTQVGVEVIIDGTPLMLSGAHQIVIVNVR